MKGLAPIVAAWGTIDSELQKLEAIAQAKGWTRKEAAIRQRRILNDRGHFLLMFATFEALLTTKARAVIQRRQAAAAWSGRRGWDVLNPANITRMPFVNRLSYCLPRNSPSWQHVFDYYSIRNELAHTGATAQPFAINLVAGHLAAAAAALRP